LISFSCWMFKVKRWSIFVILCEMWWNHWKWFCVSIWNERKEDNNIKTIWIRMNIACVEWLRQWWKLNILMCCKILRNDRMEV
jgi:hypothetical protein